MNWRIVDMSREPRRDQFAYFQTLANPYVGVTVQVDVTDLSERCRETGASFFLPPSALLFLLIFALVFCVAAAATLLAARPAMRLNPRQIFAELK